VKHLTRFASGEGSVISRRNDVFRRPTPMAYAQRRRRRRTAGAGFMDLIKSGLVGLFIYWQMKPDRGAVLRYASS